MNADMLYKRNLQLFYGGGREAYFNHKLSMIKGKSIFDMDKVRRNIHFIMGFYETNIITQKRKK